MADGNVARARPRVTREVWICAGCVLALFVLYALLARLSSGVYFDDDIQHFLIARYSWRHPALLLDYWGRPAFTALYAPAAAIGLGAARLFSALVAAVVCAGAAYLAHLYGARRAWLAALLTGLQPEFARQGFSTLTELTFALLLCASLIAYRRARLGLMALLAGLLPLARYESLPLLLIYALVLARRRAWIWLPLLGLPLLLQNGFHALWEHNAIRLLFPIGQALGIQGSTAVPEYGTGDWFYYLLRAPVAFGAIVCGLCVYGMLRTRLGMLHAAVLIAIATLTLTYALLPSAAVAGYNRHLAAVAPAAGVLAALGLNDLADRLARWRPLAWGAVGAALALALIQLAVQVRPFQPVPDQQVALAAGQWLRAQGGASLVLSAHPWIAYGAAIDPFDPALAQPITPAAIAQAPPGSWIIWDSHYAPRLGFGVPLAALRDSDRFVPAGAWENAGAQVFAYRRR
jgi:hypothetical protein